MGTVRIVLVAVMFLTAASNHAAQSTQRIPGGTVEASGVVAAPTPGVALLVDDGTPRSLLRILFNRDGAVLRSTRVSWPVSVVDPEDVTADGDWLYVVGSQSKATGRTSVGLMRFRFDPSVERVASVEVVRGLRAKLTTAVPELARLARGRGGPLNIEGLVWDVARRRLLFGLRTPLDASKAVLVSATLIDPERPLSDSNLRIESSPIRLDLGGLAVRGLGYDGATREVMIVAGSAGDGGTSWARYRWTGDAATAPVLVGQFTSTGKPEGVTRISLGDRTRTLIVYDEGRYEFVDE